MDNSTEQLMKDLADDLEEMGRQGYVVCRFCRFRFYGDNFGEVLQALGEHGEEVHPDAGKGDR